jgi:hypothetical protein
MDGILNGIRFDVFVTFCTFFTALSAFNNMAFLSAERFVSVHYPFRYIDSITTTSVTVVCLISYGLALILTTLLTTKVITFHVIHFYITLVVLVVFSLYTKIYFTARKQIRAITVLQVAPSGAHVRLPFPKCGKNTISVGIVMGIFLLSWLPYLLIPTIPESEFSHVFPWFSTCPVLQSNINPFIYFWRFAKFRQGLKRLGQKWKNRLGLL